MKAETVLLELLFDKLKTAPKEKKARKGELTLKEVIKVLRKVPEFKEDLDKALKALEKKDEQKKGRLTLVQKYILWTVAAATVPPIYILVMGALFRAMTSH